MPSARELSAEQCRWRCDPAIFGFESTAELPESTGPIGQERATRALEFGASIDSDGYNIFVLGQSGSGRHSLVLEALRRHAAEKPVPSDWCYVHNFDDPRCPRALELPPGRALEFRDDMRELIEDVDREITLAFESDEYSDRREEVVREFRERRNRELQELEREIQQAGLAIGRGPAGLIVAPAREGEVLSPQEYAQLPQQEREEIDRKRQEMQERLDEVMLHGQRIEKEARRRVAELDREVARFAIGGLFDDLRAKYESLEQVLGYLEQVREDIIDNQAIFRTEHEHEEQHPGHVHPALGLGAIDPSQSPHSRYAVNVLISHGDGDGAPVVFESKPTIENLTGDIEHFSYMGALLTDFSMIKEGALHRANGGYLVLDALTVLTRPFAWEALKRALKESQVRPESVREQLRLISTVSLEPEPIPLRAKVVLIGTPLIYYLLHAYDEEFRKLFKVKADFNLMMDRTEQSAHSYAEFIAACCHREGLPHFAPDAVALVAEEGARLAGDHHKLSTLFLDIADLVREAAYWCRRSDGELVRAQHVRRAVEESIYRSNRIEERLLELIEQGTLMVSVDGQAVGQVNGVAVLPLGDHVFGQPTRITARSFLGRPGVVNIEREVEMAGPIHNKATMILGGFLGEKFATKAPFSAAATVAFEQVYEEVEGDSAAAAELYALLSSLGRVPLRQDLSVTGSVNQHGMIQAVGGINEKIEGFFRACRLLGLTGRQGVIIPAANVRHLMLREEVVQAVADGQFHIYAAQTVDEAVELLTGMPLGERDEEGNYPDGSLGAAVQARLEQMAEAARRYREPHGDARES
ncbi:MAG: Lon protease family protein [Armatimonadota bacterium]